MLKIKVHVEFTEELLGTASANKELHSDFIASKAPDAQSREEEIAALGVEEVEEKSMTVFPRTDDGRPFLYDYQWKGFFKDSCGMLRRDKAFKSSKLTAFKKVIDGLVFPQPRKIELVLPKGGMIGNCQRPLRASTAQGERIALASSETVPEGTTQDFYVMLLKDDLLPVLFEWLDYGQLHGTGQWRNSGKGRFYVTLSDENGKRVLYTNNPRHMTKAEQSA